MRFISLFAGIGGFDFGLERAGMTCAAQVEWDAFCNLILEKHWPKIPRWGDIQKFRKILWESYCEQNDTDPHVDLICGGFPCQDISNAGLRKGIKGKRSGLWKEMLRIIREFGPEWVLVENVPTLRTRGADTVLFDLESEHYTCWTVVVGAWAAGAPHTRERIWILAHNSSKGLQGRRSFSILPEKTIPMPARSGVHAYPRGQGIEQWEWEESRLFKLPMGRTVDGVSRKLVQFNNECGIRAFGNAVVPDIVSAIGSAIYAKHYGLIDEDGWLI